MRRFADQRWLALWAAMLGYMLDALDVLLYVFAVQTLREQFHWDAATAGLVSSATLITSAIGGILSGIVADRIGRSLTLIELRPDAAARPACGPGGVRCAATGRERLSSMGFSLVGQAILPAAGFPAGVFGNEKSVVRLQPV